MENITKALREFVKLVDITGGIEYDEKGLPYPVADEEWLDLALAYIDAKKALKNEEEES